jgi:hypothetical protein
MPSMKRKRNKGKTISSLAKQTRQNIESFHKIAKGVCPKDPFANQLICDMIDMLKTTELMEKRVRSNFRSHY